MKRPKNGQRGSAITKKPLCYTHQTHARTPKKSACLCACGCGKKFKPVRSWQKYRSAKCRQKAWFLSVFKTESIADIIRRLDKLEEEFQFHLKKANSLLSGRTR
jgi:hypothetical protein